MKERSIAQDPSINCTNVDGYAVKLDPDPNSDSPHCSQVMQLEGYKLSKFEYECPDTKDLFITLQKPDGRMQSFPYSCFDSATLIREEGDIVVKVHDRRNGPEGYYYYSVGESHEVATPEPEPNATIVPTIPTPTLTPSSTRQIYSFMTVQPKNIPPENGQLNESPLPCGWFLQGALAIGVLYLATHKKNK